MKIKWVPHFCSDFFWCLRLTWMKKKVNFNCGYQVMNFKGQLKFLSKLWNFSHCHQQQPETLSDNCVKGLNTAGVTEKNPCNNNNNNNNNKPIVQNYSIKIC